MRSCLRPVATALRKLNKDKSLFAKQENQNVIFQNLHGVA